MGSYHFKLPDIGEGIAEAEVVAWHVSVGDVVVEDQSLVDVMTDKATVDMTSPVAGVVTAIHGTIGTMLPVGSVLVELAVEGAGNVAESASQAIVAPPAPLPAVEAASSPPPAPVPSARPTRSTQLRTPGDSPLASPATRRRAFELGVPLQFVSGSGSGGRIEAHDLDAYLASGQLDGVADDRYAARLGGTDTHIVGLRRKIAERMQETKRRVPHITYVEDVDVTELEALRLDLNSHRTGDEPKLTILPFLIRALVRVLPEFAQVNAHYDDDANVLHAIDGVHLGVATQTPGGLMVPVIRHAETHDLWALAREITRLSEAARDGTATREELAGSTITITSLGPLGGVTTTPIINRPEVAIIGPNKIVERPVLQNGLVSIRKVMNLSSSFDHRIVDGYDAARFIQAVKRLIEHPALIFMDAS